MTNTPDTSPEADLLAPPWLFEHVAECIRKGHATESMAGNVDCLRSGFAALSAERDALKAELAEAVEVVKWYGDRAKEARLIHSGGDAARHELQADGGKFARAFIARHQKGAGV